VCYKAATYFGQSVSNTRETLSNPKRNSGMAGVGKLALGVGPNVRASQGRGA